LPPGVGAPSIGTDDEEVEPAAPPASFSDPVAADPSDFPPPHAAKPTNKKMAIARFIAPPFGRIR
jgi:hypothetical protein